MTSGQFTAFPIDQIFVVREERQRKELVNIDELAASIAQTGLIHPPVIQRSGQLRVGERRWTACKQLGWTHIPVQFVDELNEDELQALEYEENVARVDLPWQDKARAIDHFHKLRLAQDPNWTVEKTAERLGMAERTIKDQRSVAKAMESGDARVAAAPKFSTAKNIVVRERARAQASASHVLDEQIAGEKIERKVPLLNADFADWLEAYKGDRVFNFIHCDFPYGVDLHKSGQASNAEFGSYADDAATYWQLIGRLGAAMNVVVADSAHLMFWFSMDYYAGTMDALTKMGWRVFPHPLIWFKNDNAGIMPDTNRQGRRVYETALFASRGDRFIREPVSNLFAHPGREKEIHMNEKPVAMLRHFMRMFCDEHSVVLDPTAGSANALKAASACGAKIVLGIERDPEFFQRAKEAYYDDVPPLAI